MGIVRSNEEKFFQMAYHARRGSEKSKQIMIDGLKALKVVTNKQPLVARVNQTLAELGVT